VGPHIFRPGLVFACDLLMICRYVWVARKPEGTTTADYDTHDLENEGELLEAGDSGDEETTPKNAAEAARVSSPSVLVKPTADLTLDSPHASGKAQSSQVPLQGSSMDAPEIRISRRDAESVPTLLKPSSSNSTDAPPPVTAEPSSRAATIPSQSIIASIESQEAERSTNKDGRLIESGSVAECMQNGETYPLLPSGRLVYSYVCRISEGK
jgi:hypothetical protein